MSKPLFSQSSGKMEKHLVGRWSWVRSTSSFIGTAPGTDSPEKCHCSKSLVFEKGKVRVYRNDTLLDEGAYSVNEVHFLQDPVRYVLMSKALNNDISIEKDTLRVGQAGNCAVLEYYSRSISKNKKKKSRSTPAKVK